MPLCFWINCIIFHVKDDFWLKPFSECKTSLLKSICDLKRGSPGSQCKAGTPAKATFLTHSFLSEHVGCWYLWDIANNTEAFSWMPRCLLMGPFPKLGFVDYMISPFFEESWCYFLDHRLHFSLPTMVHKDSKSSLHTLLITTLVIFWCFDHEHLNRYLVLSLFNDDEKCLGVHTVHA